MYRKCNNLKFSVYLYVITYAGVIGIGAFNSKFNVWYHKKFLDLDYITISIPSILQFEFHIKNGGKF